MSDESTVPDDQPPSGPTAAEAQPPDSTAPPQPAPELRPLAEQPRPTSSTAYAGQPVAAQGLPGQPAFQAPPSIVSQALSPLGRAPAQISFLLTLAAVLGTALISAILILVTITSSTDKAPSGIPLLLVAMGYSLGGHLTGGIDEGSHGSVSIGASMLPLGTLAAAATTVYFLARRRARQDESWGPFGAVALRAALEALATAIVACLLTGIVSLSGDGMSRGLEKGEIHTSPVWILLSVWVLVFGALTAARAGSALLARAPETIQRLVRELGGLAWAVGVVLGPVVVLGAIVGAALKDAAPAILVIPVYLGNLLVYALSLGTLGGVSLSTDLRNALGIFEDMPVDAGTTILAWDALGGWSALLFLAILVLLVVAAARIGTRRQRLAAPSFERVWQMPVAGLVLAVVALHLLVPLRVHIGISVARLASSSAGFSLGASWWSSLALALILLVISLLAEYIPGLLHAHAGPLLRLIGGGTAVDRWITGLPTTGALPMASDQFAPAPAISTSPIASADPTAATPPSPEVPAVSPGTGAFPLSAPGTGALPLAAPATGSFPAGATLAAGGTASASAIPPLMSPQARRHLKLATGAVVACLALLMGVFIAVEVLNSQRTPKKEVEKYLDLVAAGKASEATAMVDPGVPNDRRALLTDSAMSATTSRITVVDVEEKGRGNDKKRVEATLSLNGKQITQIFTVSSEDKSFGLLNNWKVETSLAMPVQLSSESLGGLSVGGTEVTLENPGKGAKGLTSSERTGGTATQYMYPGIYPITSTSATSAYVTTDESSVTVLPGDGGASGILLAVEGKPTEELKQYVLTKINEKAASCVTPPTNTDSFCPYELRATDLASLSVTTPASTVTMDNTSIFKSGTIVFTYRKKPSTWNKNPKDQTVKYAFSGTVELSGSGDPEVAVTRAAHSYVF
ncbi:hypothetical protein [Actinomyces gaoshouyii]|uniref:Uncharacterized protein n=1 Tax=Actinomyces gaoshouyii TaxID=1960083 RepID=A0A8H9H771_9ACTO|nr:hypothetical protein [Actinomyces gaoshouyii]GGO94895.1 hypothetical protein GCM10011612_01440 [Actinomyces gaoshouyii]